MTFIQKVKTTNFQTAVQNTHIQKDKIVMSYNDVIENDIV